MKKDGGIIKNWQLHHLTFLQENIEKVYPGENAKPIVFTGTVVSDPTGRWSPGHHMRSSLIVLIDRKKGIIETINTTYRVQDEGNDIFSDIGDDVLKVSY